VNAESEVLTAKGEVWAHFLKSEEKAHRGWARLLLNRARDLITHDPAPTEKRKTLDTNTGALWLHNTTPTHPSNFYLDRGAGGKVSEKNRGGRCCGAPSYALYSSDKRAFSASMLSSAAKRQASALCACSTTAVSSEGRPRALVGARASRARHCASNPRPGLRHSRCRV